jgi:Glycosyl transferase family 21
VSNPRSIAAAANGQYLLVSREAYDAVGGHAAVGKSLLEDVALARAVKTAGRRISFRYGGDMVRARMYRSLSQLTEGWTKNLALLFAEPLWLAFCRFSEFVLIVAGLSLLLLANWTKGISALAMAASVLSGTFWYFFMQRVRRAHFSWPSNLLALLGLPFFAYLLLRSKAFHKRGAISWKGRTYAGDTTRISPVS